jgi:hypothetical protein
MLKTAISWIVLGVLAYLWWWLANRWSYLHSPGNQWTSVYLLFSLVSLAILVRLPRSSGTGMFDGIVHSIRGLLPALPWMALAVVVMRGIAWLHLGAPGEPLDHFIRAIVAALFAGITTALWFGALENGRRSA